MTNRRYLLLGELVEETPWHILPSKLYEIQMFWARVKRGDINVDAGIVDVLAAARQRQKQPAAGSIGVLPLYGSIFPRANLMGDISGGTSLEAFAAAYREMMADPNIAAVVIDVDSPGGSASMMTETAAIIRNGKTKPLVAVANTMAASAAYGLAAQADEFVASPSATVGSVGTYTIHQDVTGMLEAAGVKITPVQAGQYKTELAPFVALSEDAQAAMQSMVDQYQAKFESDIAKGRGTTEATVRNSYGQGRLLTAQDALAAGMIDRIATYEQVVAGLLKSGGALQRGKATAAVPGDRVLVTDARGDWGFGNAIAAAFSGSSSRAMTAAELQEAFARAEPEVLSGPIPPRGTKVVDQPWDGPAEEAKIPNDAKAETLRLMYAWVDPAKDADTKSAYKFPHHAVVDGEPGPANIAGVRAAMARADQQQTQIPDSDRAGVKRHLQKHIDDFEAAHASTSSVPSGADGRATAPATTTPTLKEGEVKTMEELVARQAEIVARQTELDAEHVGKQLEGDAKVEFDQLDDEWVANQAAIDDMERRLRSIAMKGGANGANEGGNGHVVDEARRGGGPSVITASRRNIPENIWDLSGYRKHASSLDELAALYQEGARRANEITTYETDTPERPKTFVERLLAKDSKDGSFAQRLLITSSKQYDEAFGKVVMGRPLTQAEQSLINQAISVGGLGAETPVPVTIDPTVLLTSDGVANPMRAISRNVTITGNTWRGISSDGVTVDYAAELAAVDPQTPTFDAPDISVVKAQAEVQFSIEVDQDWGALRGELATMFQDAKDTKEANKFLFGTGTNEPEGLIHALVTDGTSLVDTATINTLDLDDPDLAVNDLPPRFDGNAQWIGNRAVFGALRSLARAAGIQDVWVPIAQGFPNRPQGTTGYEFNGYPVNIASEMSKAITTGSEIVLVLGDFSRGFVIVDRVGLNVELDPLVRNSSGKLIGARALYVYFRNTSALRTPAAFRALRIKHS